VPDAHLWWQPAFYFGFISLVVLAAFGAYGFIAHWGRRSVGPVLACLPMVPVVFGWSPYLIALAFVIAFVGVAYLVSPDRGGATTEISAQPIVSKWDDIAPLANAYARTRGLAVRLATFIEESEAQKAPLEFPLQPGYLTEPLKEIKETKERFDREFLQELVQLVSDLKSEFGLVSSAFADDILTDNFTGSKRFREFVHALDGMAEKLKTMLAEKATALEAG
jgi:hypothetical protein